MPNQTHDIIIVGGGIVGLLLARALAPHDFQIALIEAKKPCQTWSATDYDARVVALNQYSLNVLQQLQIWPHIDMASRSPIEEMSIWDSLGGGEIEFDAADMGLSQLGCIIENRALIKALWQSCSEFSNIHIIYPHTPQALQKKSDEIAITLDNQTTLQAPLAIAADGAHSWLRDHMNAELQVSSYQQQAIVAVVATEHPHRNIARQNFLLQGPLGLLPLADAKHMAIVWSTHTDHAQQLMALSEHEFNLALMNATEQRLGHIQLISARQMIPLIMRHARNYVQERMALIGDAAHTLHPLAGQGVNLGICDAIELTECLLNARNKGHDIGSLRPLRQYERARKGDNALMLTAMRLFKEIFSSDSPLLVQIRCQGLNAVNRIQWLKKFFMRCAGSVIQ